MVRWSPFQGEGSGSNPDRANAIAGSVIIPDSEAFANMPSRDMLNVNQMTWKLCSLWVKRRRPLATTKREQAIGSNPIGARGVEMDWSFPLDVCYGIPINPHPGAFAYPRRGFKHCGVDLYTDLGAEVHSVEDGTIVSIEHFTGEWDNSPWWNNTDCVMVKGESGVVNYGEIQPRADLKIGMNVLRGETLGTVLRVIKEGKDHYEITGWRPTMLHLELYPSDATKASQGFQDFLRDPTPFLNKWHNLFVTYDGYKR